MIHHCSVVHQISELVTCSMFVSSISELVTVVQVTLRRPNSSVEFADSDSTAAAVFQLPEDAEASASNVAISSVFRVVEGADL